MNRYAVLAFTSLAVLCCASLRAEDAPKTGLFTETFTDRSPHSAMDKLGPRIGLPEPARIDYDLSKEAFSVYVPKDYKADGSYGLIVYMSVQDSGDPVHGYGPVLDKYKLIWIGAHKQTGVPNFSKGFGMALDGVEIISKRYKIDPNRIYISGVANASASSVLGVCYPEVFTGGGYYMMGSRFYKAAKGPGENGAQINSGYNPPDATTLDTAKKKRAYVFLTGATSTDLGPTDKAVFEGYKAEGFAHVDLMEIPGAGNVIPPADWFEKGLARLEDLRGKASGSQPVTPTTPTTPTTPGTPDKPTPPTATKPEVKKGSFAATFDKRSPYSMVPVMSKVVNSVNRTAAEYDITKESFHVYVPNHYEPGKPFGLLVHLSSEVANTDAELAAFWKLAFDKKNYIFVAVSKCPMTEPDQKRIGLALDAVENIKHLYTIDDDRIYLMGVSQSSPHLVKTAIHYPQVFNGAVVLVGMAYFRDVLEGTTKYLGGVQQPSNAILKEAKTRSRFVFVYDKEQSPARTFIHMLFTKGWSVDFAYAKSIEIEKRGGGLPGIKTLQEAIELVDEPLEKSERQLLSEGARLEKNRKMGEAWLAYGKVAMRTDDEKRKIEAEGKAAAIQKLYDEHMSGAKKALAAGDQVTAKTSLERIVKEYGSVPDDEAEKLYDSVSGGKTVARGPNNIGPKNPDEKGPPPLAAGAETVAKNRLDAARKVLAANLTAGYKELRDIAERYGETAAGKEALAEADKIWADGTKRKTIESQTAEAEAVKLMTLAKRYLDAGDFLNAKEKLNQIVEDYPESKVATEAASLFAGIKDK